MEHHQRWLTAWRRIKKDEIAERGVWLYVTFFLTSLASLGWGRALADEGAKGLILLIFTAKWTVIFFLVSIVVTFLIGVASFFTDYAKRAIPAAIATYLFSAVLRTLLVLGGGGIVLGLIIFHGEFLWIGPILEFIKTLKP